MGDLTEKKPEEMNEAHQDSVVDGQQENEEVDFVLDGETETSASQSVPVATHIDLKKRLRGTKQQNQNLEEKLKAQEQEIALLKMSTTAKEPELVAPSRSEYLDEYGDKDNDSYIEALSKYNVAIQEKASNETKKLEEKFNNRLDELHEGSVKKKQESLIDDALVESVKQADELGIKNYDSVVSDVAQAMPEGAYESLLSQKVIDAKTTYYLHKNPEKIQDIINTAKTFGDGAAINKIAEIRLKLKPRNYQSPPDPDSPVTGAKGGGSINYQNLIDKERAKPSSEYDAQAVISLKQKARDAGIDVR